MKFRRPFFIAAFLLATKEHKEHKDKNLFFLSVQSVQSVV